MAPLTLKRLRQRHAFYDLSSVIACGALPAYARVCDPPPEGTSLVTRIATSYVGPTMRWKCFFKVIGPVNPEATVKLPTTCPLITRFQSTWLPAVRKFDTTSTFRITLFALEGPERDWLTLSPLAADQKYPTWVPSMNPVLAMTVEVLDGNENFVATCVVEVAYPGVTVRKRTATTANIPTPANAPLRLTQNPPSLDDP